MFLQKGELGRTDPCPIFDVVTCKTQKTNWTKRHKSKKGKLTSKAGPKMEMANPKITDRRLGEEPPFNAGGAGGVV